MSALLVPTWIAGCSAHYGGHIGESMHPGDAGLHMSVGISGAAADVVVGGAMLGILAAGAGYDSTPPMKADRTINEQDCTKPLVNQAANLRCRRGE